MSNQNSTNIVVNLIGFGAAAIVVGWILHSVITAQGISVCEERYPSSTRLGLAREDGTPLSQTELQAQVGVNEWGVLHNSKVVSADDSLSEQVIEVRLEKGTGSGFKEGQPRGGVSFVWSPVDMGNATAACLSYKVFLPEDFDFTASGTLPGLFIGRDFDARGEAVKGTGAGSRVSWQKDGGAIVQLQFANSEGWQNPPLTRAKVNLPRGRWVGIDEEVILNTSGLKDGQVRLWLDGELVGENRGIGVRSDDGQELAGVLADVHYGTVFNSAVAPKDAQIRLTPFVVRWQ